MSSYDNPELRYSCYSEPSLVSHNHLSSLTLRAMFVSLLEGYS